jgi:putative transposase
LISAAAGLAGTVGAKDACRALGVPRASYYRSLRPAGFAPRTANQCPAWSLNPEERQAVLDQLHCERFVDKSPAEIHATLLDEGIYLCSERTMYRVLAEAKEVRERRNQLRHPKHAVPVLVATGPNQVWSWDITKLLGPVKWTFYYLYVLLDIYSRYVVGWLLATEESTALAKVLISESCEKEGIRSGTLTIHADRGSSMKSKPLAQLLGNLGITKTHSRPRVSNDNPYSESQFKTLKYCPRFPGRFGCLEDARAFCRWFFRWYDDEHRHSGIAMLTPASVHRGMSSEILRRRMAVLEAAYQAHPERFPRRPQLQQLPEQVWINRPERCLGKEELQA